MTLDKRAYGKRDDRYGRHLRKVAAHVRRLPDSEQRAVVVARRKARKATR